MHLRRIKKTLHLQRSGGQKIVMKCEEKKKLNEKTNVFNMVNE